MTDVGTNVPFSFQPQSFSVLLPANFVALLHGPSLRVNQEIGASELDIKNYQLKLSSTFRQHQDIHMFSRRGSINYSKCLGLSLSRSVVASENFEKKILIVIQNHEISG